MTLAQKCEARLAQKCQARLAKMSLFHLPPSIIIRNFQKGQAGGCQASQGLVSSLKILRWLLKGSQPARNLNASRYTARSPALHALVLSTPLIRPFSARQRSMSQRGTKLGCLEWLVPGILPPNQPYSVQNCTQLKSRITTQEPIIHNISQKRGTRRLLEPWTSYQ